MELTGYVESLRSALATAAAAGGDDALQLAERLTAPLDAAARLVLQEALADAAQEITRDLAPGSVELRLRGRDLAFVVSQPPTLDSADAFAAGQPQVGSERGSDAAGEGATSRISFRPPDQLKVRIEEAAEREGLSVNSFLVRTLANVLEPGKQFSTRKDPDGGEHIGGWYR